MMSTDENDSFFRRNLDSPRFSIKTSLNKEIYGQNRTVLPLVRTNENSKDRKLNLDKILRRIQHVSDILSSRLKK